MKKTCFLAIFCWVALFVDSSAAADDCVSISILNETCFNQTESFFCNDNGVLVIEVYEDCPENVLVLRVEEEGVSSITDCNDELYAVGLDFGFLKVDDADGDNPDAPFCSDFLTFDNGSSAYAISITFLDVNEYPPMPVDIDPIFPFDADENSVCEFEFGYADDDSGEIDSIYFEFIDDAEGFFILEKATKLNNEVQMFSLYSTDDLDFETKSFYNLEIKFTTFDSRGNESSTTQKFYISVTDLGDNAPIFTTICPFQTIDETNETVSICSVAARDGDVLVNNEIYYSIASVNPEFGSDFFQVDSSTGEISTTGEDIDSESLNSTSFAIEIKATELLKSGEEAPDPNSSTQITNVYVSDINDNSPEFDDDKYTVELEEFNQETSTPNEERTIANLTIIITDNDEGLFGTYYITSDNNFVILNPTSGSGVTEVSVKVLNDDIFDYEQHDPTDNKIVVTLTAQETEDESHISEAKLVITLLDINDNSPEFEQQSYEASCDENSVEETIIIQVQANDNDTTEDYKQITYSILDCEEYLEIDKKGSVTVTQDADLNYEVEPNITCRVVASDGELEDTKDLVLYLEDVNDVDPSFEVFESEISESENATVGIVLTTINVIDVDITAKISVSMEFPDNPGREIKRWFALEIDESSTDSNYIGNLVIEKSMDREALQNEDDNVIIDFIAVDTNGETIGVQVQQTIERMTITILDVKDKTPEFNADYSALNFDENVVEGDVVAVIEATDLDKNDTVTFEISKNDYLEIVDETVGNISVKADEIDRENIADFDVTVTIRDTINSSDSVKITFTVNDLNDNDPDFNNSCNKVPEVSEGAENGMEVATIEATDADEGVHAQVSYALRTPENSAAQIPPFAIDSTSGLITVDNSTGTLDREVYSEWTITIAAQDGCAPEEEITCTERITICTMDILITDVNDESPGSYRLTNTVGDEIQTDEDLKKKEEIPNVQISATDLDEVGTKNSEITFSATNLYLNGSEVDQFFQANTLYFENDYYYICTLEALQDLTHLRGQYIITIEGIDSGEDPMPSYYNFSLNIQDTNDWTPEIYLSSCLEDSDNEISIIENKTPNSIPFPCSPRHETSLALIIVVDQDEPRTSNSEVLVQINRDQSDCTDGGIDNQLNNFRVYDFGDNKNFGLQLANGTTIDRERGSVYLLALDAYDNGSPNALMSSTLVTVIVEDVNEFAPLFCPSKECQQVVGIAENSSEPIPFQMAEDEDNLSGNGDEILNDKIYYSIVEPLGNSIFYIPDAEVNSLELLPDFELDRETTSVYEIFIMASNFKNQEIEATDQTGQLLQLTVNILDVNDVTPHYNETIFGAFLNTDNKGDQVAIVEFYDEDFNDTLDYTIGDDIVWIPEQNFDQPFEIDKETNRRSEIVLNMNPIAATGQCSFTIYANDQNKNHLAASTTVQVFVITEEYIVAFYFNNNLVTINSNIDEIEAILSDVFGFVCQIDATDFIDEESVVYAHFIDVIASSPSLVPSEGSLSPQVVNIVRDNEEEMPSSNGLNELEPDSVLKGLATDIITTNNKTELGSDQSWRRKVVSTKLSDGLISPMGSFKPAVSAGYQYELVPEEQIEEMGTSGEVANDLITQCSAIGLEIDRIGDQPTFDSNTYEETITALKISIGAICLVLGLLLLLMAIAYWHKTRKLNRQLKVMSTKTMGSKSSGLNQLGGGAPVPGSNVYSGQKSNPVLNLEEVIAETKDSDSIGSGDSVLIGVEDNPEFTKYIESRRALYENPSGESTNEDQHRHSDSTAIVRRNPLNRSSDNSSEDRNPYDTGSDDRNSIAEHLDSNFSFSI